MPPPTGSIILSFRLPHFREYFINPCVYRPPTTIHSFSLPAYSGSPRRGGSLSLMRWTSIHLFSNKGSIKVHFIVAQKHQYQPYHPTFHSIRYEGLPVKASTALFKNKQKHGATLKQLQQTWNTQILTLKKKRTQIWKQDRANIFWRKRKRTRVGVTTNTAGAN